MFVSGITCSGVNEKNKVDEVIDFCKQFPSVELGIQCSPKKFDEGRYEWIMELCAKLMENKCCTKLALHLNQSFATEFCDGKIPLPIQKFIYAKNTSGHPLIERLQLNFMLGREKFAQDKYAPDIFQLKKSIDALNGQKVILSCSEANIPFVRKIHRQHIIFDALYDDSFGEGIIPEMRKPPLFRDVYQGYAGGLGPDNIADELSSIEQITNAKIFVDAEGKLKENNCFSFAKATTFVKNIYSWNQKSSNNLFFKNKSGIYSY